MRLIPTTFLASLAIAAPYVSGLTCPKADANLGRSFNIIVSLFDDKVGHASRLSASDKIHNNADLETSYSVDDYRH